MEQFKPSCKNVILVDADKLDRTAFDLIVNFERVLERRIPKADISKWLRAASLDGGISKNNIGTEVILLFSKDKGKMDNFSTENCDEMVENQTITNDLGSYTLRFVKAEEGIAQNFIEYMSILVGSESKLEHLICVPDETEYGKLVANVARVATCDVTLLTMETLTGHGFSQETLSYSLLYALGISTEDL